MTANPSAGWGFTGWSGDLTGSVNPASDLTLTANKTVDATFTQSRIFDGYSGWWWFCYSERYWALSFR